MTKHKIFGGLQKLSNDERDFSLGGIFKQIDVKEVPFKDFYVSQPLIIKDQGNSDFCSAFTVTEISEDQEKVELSPEYQFFKTKELMGNTDWGADLRTAFKVPVKFGSIPAEEKYKDLTRDEILNPKTWKNIDTIDALKYRKETFFKITGRYDTFDNIRVAMWQFFNENRSIGVGAMWRSSWTDSPGGVIGEEETEVEFGHAFKIFGQKIINGQPYLVAQLSNGTDIGDNGLFYFPRSVVNRDFKDFGQFMFKDISRGEVEAHRDIGVKIGDNFLKKLLILFGYNFINFFKR